MQFSREPDLTQLGLCNLEDENVTHVLICRCKDNLSVYMKRTLKFYVWNALCTTQITRSGRLV